MKKQSLFILIIHLMLSIGVNAQSYVTDWPIESLKPSAETLQKLEHQNDDVPYYLQNRTFRDTIYDTTTWQTLADIEYRYIKALGNSTSKYCVDVEILEDESVIIPWYQFNGDGLHITKVDSLGEEIYTNVYDNIASAQFHIYRKDTILEFVGKFNINGKKRFGMLKFNLITNDTISVTSLGNVSSAFVLDAINTCQLDSTRYVLSTSDVFTEEYIYICNSDTILDSIYYNDYIKMVYVYNDSIFIINRNGKVSSVDETGITTSAVINCDRISYGLLKDGNLYIKNGSNGILKLNSTYNEIFYSRVSEPGFIASFPNGIHITKDSFLLVAAGVSTDNWIPLGEDQSIGLYLINKEGAYINKLYIGGANFSNQQVFELKNGDYLFIANADENQTGNGTIFLMRIKPWEYNVGIANLIDKVSLEVYPNPAKNYLNIDIQGLYNYSIYNLTGQLVLNGSSDNNRININQLNTGGHLLIIRQQNRSLSKLFIKN